ncbi:MAG TPA: hypothetical protein PK668_00450 [Myxococcota bacterium]|nr:hypothetical protein [Myxococcota bacterium]HRY95699.1 hypothetical protein [Myxococcota bacterium]HSA20185.1 hypothetical protein [Myxococcota bacterium]
MRARTLACLLGVLSLSAPALAGPPRLVKQLPVPTDREYHLLNPDRYVQVRVERLLAEPPNRCLDGLAVTVVDLAKLEAVELRIDLKPLVAERAEMFLDGQPTWQNQAGDTHASFQVKLLRYDPERGRSGLLVDNRPPDEGGAWRRRLLYVPWDPRENRLGKEIVLHEVEGDRSSPDARRFTELGPDPTGRYEYFLATEKLPEDDSGRSATRLLALRLDLDTRQVDWRYSLETAPASRPAFGSFGTFLGGLSRDGGLLLLAEYTETWDTPLEPPPEVRIIDVAKQSHFGLPILHTPYGLVVGPQAQLLVVANSQDRKLVAYDLDKRARLRDAAAPGQVHKAVLSRDGKGVWLFARGRTLELRALPTLKLQASFPIGKLLPGTPALDAERSAVTLDGRFLVAPEADPHGFGKDQGLFVLELP